MSPESAALVLRNTSPISVAAKGPSYQKDVIEKELFQIIPEYRVIDGVVPRVHGAVIGIDQFVLFTQLIGIGFDIGMLQRGGMILQLCQPLPAIRFLTFIALCELLSEVIIIVPGRIPATRCVASALRRDRPRRQRRH
jgi:hypothetical protein